MKALAEENRLDDLINEKKKNDKLVQYDQNLEKTKMAKALARQERQAAHNRFVFTLACCFRTIIKPVCWHNPVLP